MNIGGILQDHARRHPHDVALFDVHRGRSRATTYGELERAAGRTAGLLRQSGLRAGETVLVFQPMSAELYVALAAILRLGLTAMFVDPSAGRRYIDRCCRLLPPQGLIAGSRGHLLRLLSPGVRRIPVKFSIGPPVPGARRLERAGGCDYDDVVHAAAADAAALVSFTSGGTGEPKAAVRTHGFLLAQHAVIEESLSLRAGEVEMATLPIFVLANLASRVASIIPAADLRRPDAIAAAPLVAQMRQHGADRAAASPAFYERIVDYCEARSLTLPGLKKVFTGGGPVSPLLLDRLQGVAPRATITVVYGSTEAEPISHVSLNEMRNADRAAMAAGEGLLSGRPVPGLDVRILGDRWGEAIGSLTSEEFQRLCRPAGDAGEIVVSGAHVLPSYLAGRGDDENKFRVDAARWHRTGDAGRFDEQGRLWLLGRCAARVEDSRGALYPLGVEQAALRHPHIGRAAMISHRGRRVLAVALRDSAATPDLSSLLKSLSFAGVDSIRVLRRIPVDSRHNAKTDYPALLSLLEQQS